MLKHRASEVQPPWWDVTGHQWPSLHCRDLRSRPGPSNLCRWNFFARQNTEKSRVSHP